MEAQPIPKDAIKLYDLYIHGEIPRREFMDRLNTFTAAGLALPALVEALMPNYAAGQQVAPTGPRPRASTSPPGEGAAAGCGDSLELSRGGASEVEPVARS
jgi:carboxymethylenebutenolidase